MKLILWDRGSQKRPLACPCVTPVFSRCVLIIINCKLQRTNAPIPSPWCPWEAVKYSLIKQNLVITGEAAPWQLLKGSKDATNYIKITMAISVPGFSPF